MLPTADNLQYPFIAKNMEIGSNRKILLVTGNSTNSLDCQPQHLYFTNGEKIGVGDNVLSKLYGLGKVVSNQWADNKGKTPMLVQFKDKAIMYGKDGSYKDDGNKMYLNDCYKIVASSDESLNLPQIPQSFIKQYVKANGKIDEVEIKYINEPIYTGDGCHKDNWILKVDSNNCVIVCNVLAKTGDGNTCNEDSEPLVKGAVMPSIYSMKLHEVITIDPSSVGGTAVSYFSIMRVAGGWIYQIWDSEKQDYVRELFVPFNNEFMIV